MVTAAPLSPRIVLVDQTGKLTSEGFRLLQALTQAVSGGGTFQPLNTILTGLSGMGTGTGLVAQTAAASFLKRTLAASSPILIANPDGVAGNPTFTGDIASNAEAIAGVDTTKIIVSSALAAALASSGGSYQPLDADLTSWAGVTRASGFDAFTATPSSANLAALLTDETGTAGTVPFASSGTWTPVLTFATPGDLAITYSAGNQLGEYYRSGNWVDLYFRILTTAFTWTTAAGVGTITGSPFTSRNSGGNIRWTGTFSGLRGVTKANYTQFAPVADVNSSVISLVAMGSAQVNSTMNAADFPTGGTVLLQGWVGFPL